MSSLHVFLPLSLLSSGDLGRVQEGGWAAEKRLRGGGGPPPPAKPLPELPQVLWAMVERLDPKKEYSRDFWL